MKNFFRVLIPGTVICLMTVPFLFGQGEYPSCLDLNGNLLMKEFAQDYKMTSPFMITNTIVPDSVIKKKKEAEAFRMKKKPWLALTLSAVVPGAGQFYNESYWKVPVILGLAGYLGYQYWDNNRKYLDYRDLYSQSQMQDPPDGDQNLKTLREFYRDQRNDFVWYFMLVYVVNLVDAYVDAHLFDFDIRDEKFAGAEGGSKKFRLSFKLTL